MGEKGVGLSRNMYKGHMDKAKGGRFKGGKWGWLWWEKMETTVLEKQFKK